jgi:hypothetical protein
MRSAFQDRAQQGLSIMEAAAMHVQIQAAAIDLGPPAAEALSATLRQMSSRYRETLDALWSMQDELRIGDTEFAPVALALMLVCLLDASPMAVETLTVPLTERARGLDGAAAAQLILSAAAATIERVVSRAMQAAQEANEEFLGALDKALPEPIHDLARDAFADFARAAAALQDQFLDDPMLLLDPGRYLRAEPHELVRPFVYLLSDGATTMQTRGRSWEGSLTDPLTYVREYEKNGQPVFELVCVPAPMPAHGLDEAAWKNFADSVAGSLVIAEGADRSHPVEGMWIRKMEERWPISFTPFGSHAAWQAAPAGAVV